jgi:hypothetical protein
MKSQETLQLATLPSICSFVVVEQGVFVKLRVREETAVYINFRVPLSLLLL